MYYTSESEVWQVALIDWPREAGVPHPPLIPPLQGKGIWIRVNCCVEELGMG
jgi:hypothetical protein